MEYFLRKVKGIVIDAGHGGDDPGASGNGIIEKDYNLRAAQYMNDRFKQLGIPTAMTRTTDETLNSTERVRRILNAFGNSEDVIVLSNHINAGGGDGAEIVYALRNNDALARRVLNSIGDEGQNLRKYYQRRLPSDPSKDYYFIHRETGKTQPLLIEYGFLDSPGDDVNQLKNNFLDYVEAVVKAVAEYAGVTYVPPVGSNTYIVKAGDSLWKIANNIGISVDELKSYNNLTSNLLSIGQVLKIPNNVQDDVNTEFDNYVVQPGDSLWKIANQFNISVDELKSYNNLASNLLNIGQVLKIPNMNNNSDDVVNDASTYIVKSGDSLWNIAKRYGVSVDELKSYNNLTSNLLSIGQVLKIPGMNPSNTYVVKSGDSLWKIANNYGVSVDELIALNNLNSNLLSIGQVLLIP